jgi:hypothetical protein
MIGDDYLFREGAKTMIVNRERFLELLEQITPEQQEDLLRLMEKWAAMPKPGHNATDGELSPSHSVLSNPILSKEWHCLSALKKVVEKHFPAQIELAYIAFHPDLNSISTAKTKPAARKMYALEAAYELKNILEHSPDSDLLDEDVLKTLHDYLHLKHDD